MIILFHFLVCSKHSEDEEQGNEERLYAHNIYIRFIDYTMNYQVHKLKNEIYEIGKNT